MKTIFFLPVFFCVALNSLAAPAAAPKFLYHGNPAHSESVLTDVDSSFTIMPQEGDKILVTAKPASKNWAGFAFRPKSAEAWDLSAWGWIEAKITNHSKTSRLGIAMRIDMPGDWRKEPWNSESVLLKPGESKVLRVYPGYHYGYKPGYPVSLKTLSQILFFRTSKGTEEISFSVEALKASGSPEDKPAAPKQPEEKRDFHGNIFTVQTPKAEIPPQLANAADGFCRISLSAKPGWLKITPPPGRKQWNLRRFNQVDVTLKNPSGKTLSFGMELGSVGGNSPTVPVVLKPYEMRRIPLSFVSRNHPCRLAETIVKGMKPHQIFEKGAGTKFESDRANSIIFRNTEPMELLIGEIRASAPAGKFPEWLGKRPPVPGNWNLTFEEEFNTSAVDLRRWNIYTPNFWDQQTHFSKDNVILSNGCAYLRYEQKTGFHNDDPEDKSKVSKTGFACGFLDTYGKWTQRYGYWEARMKLPQAQGLWPAFWTMPDRGADKNPLKNLQWKRSNTANGGMEFDIMEHLTGWGPYRFNAAMHWDGYGEKHTAAGTSNVYVQTDREGFMTIGMLWLPGYLAYYANGELFLEWKSSRVCSVPSYPILYMVSGGWANTPLNPEELPADFVIDYVRIWQRADFASPADGPKPNNGNPRSQW